MAIKVMVVDDSMMMRKMVKDIVGSDPDIEVVGDANNGEVALQKTKSLNPDIILLDIEMPVMDGVEFLKRVKLISKAKVVVLSSLTQAGSSVSTEVRQLGAVDVIPKPSGGVSLDLERKRGHEIVKAVRKACGLPNRS